MLILSCLHFCCVVECPWVLFFFFSRFVDWLPYAHVEETRGRKTCLRQSFQKLQVFFLNFGTCCITLYTNTERKCDIVSRFTVSLLLISIREHQATRKHQSKGKKLAWTCSKMQGFWIVWTRCIFKQPKSNNYWKHLCSIMCSCTYPS